MSAQSDRASALRAFVDAHRSLLRATLDVFMRDGSWPQLRELQRSADRAGEDVDVAAVVFAMPNELGFHEQQRLILRVRALSELPEAEELLQAWASALSLAYDRYLHDDEAKLSRRDLREGLGLDELLVNRVSQLLLRESWAFGSGGGDAGGDWHREIDVGVRAVRAGRDPSSILAARDALDVPSPAHAAAWPGRASQSASTVVDQPVTRDDRAVMVVSGRDEEFNQALFGFLQALDLRPKSWNELIRATRSGSPYTGEVLDRAMDTVQAVVVVFGPDEWAGLRDGLGDERRNDGGQPRPNVLFEAGLAFGRHPDRTIIVEHGELREISDLTGRHAVRLRPTVTALHDLAGRLTSAGCRTELSGSDWLRVERFPAWRVAAAPAERSLAAAAAGPATASARQEHSSIEGLQRLLEEIFRAAGHAPSEDVIRLIAERIRALSGPSGGDDIFGRLPGRMLPVETIKRVRYELLEHGVLRRNPHGRGVVRGQLPD